MNVLSLFDGMSCGQIALERAGVHADRYLTSEIDRYAINVAHNNYPQTVNLGDVKHISHRTLCGIDLLIGGSPCQGFSFAGKQLNFSDSRSELFFEYVRMLEKMGPKYFLLENVKMKKECQDVISSYLGVEPIEINSNLVSAQNRRRLYWTNIPNVSQPIDAGTKIIDVLENITFDREPYEEKYKSNIAINYKRDKFNTLRAQAGSKTRGIGICNDEGWWRKLTPVECERLQTVPDFYTQGVSDTQRYKMLGNGWTVDVIAHIFKGMELT